MLRSLYRKRRRLLEELELESPHVSVPESFDDGEALFAAVCERGLEGGGREEALREAGRDETGLVVCKKRVRAGTFGGKPHV